eukprot:1189622-Prorocentrum_minimum.AAC.2
MAVGGGFVAVGGSLPDGPPVLRPAPRRPRTAWTPARSYAGPCSSPLQPSVPPQSASSDGPKARTLGVYLRGTHEVHFSNPKPPELRG